MGLGLQNLKLGVLLPHSGVSFCDPYEIFSLYAYGSTSGYLMLDRNPQVYARLVLFSDVYQLQDYNCK